MLGFVECFDCRVALTKKFELRQEHLELSWVTYIAHILHSTHICYMSYPPDVPPTSNECQHIRKCRVFQLGTYFMRVYTDFLILSKPYILSESQKQRVFFDKEQSFKNEIALELSLNLESIINLIKSDLIRISDLIKSYQIEPNKSPKLSFSRSKSEIGTVSLSTKQYL